MRRDRAAESDFSTPAPIAAQFDEIAFLYDELMTGVPYSVWIDYVERILARMGCGPRRVLDLCCGTGSASALMVDRGYQVAGVDVSSEMIERARQKALAAGKQIEYRVGDASDFSLPGKFDLVISLFDSLNYILEADKLQQAFYRVAEHLEPNGLFIFDMNTEFALAAGFFDQCNAATRGPVVYDWKSSYNAATRICRIAMSFLYRREIPPREVQLVHYQRAYDQEEVCEMLRAAGFEVHAVYDGYTFQPATRRSDRVFFVARKLAADP